MSFSIDGLDLKCTWVNCNNETMTIVGCSYKNEWPRRGRRVWIEMCTRGLHNVFTAFVRWNDVSFIEDFYTEESLQLTFALNVFCVFLAYADR